MLALIFGVLFAVSFLGFAITSRTKYSAASHLFWSVAFIIFTVCFTYVILENGVQGLRFY